MTYRNVDKVNTIEWSIQLLYDMHWAIKKEGLDTSGGQAGLHDILTSMVETIRDSALKIAELEQEVGRLKAAQRSPSLVVSSSSPQTEDSQEVATVH